MSLKNGENIGEERGDSGQTDPEARNFSIFTLVQPLSESVPCCGSSMQVHFERSQSRKRKFPLHTLYVANNLLPLVLN